MSQISRQIAKNASVVGSATLFSRVLGFVRDVLVAYFMGAGVLADAFNVAFRLPNLLRSLFAEGSMTMAFVPVYARVRNEEGEERAQAMARSCLAWLVLILGVVTALAIVFSRELTALAAPGFVGRPEAFELTVLLVRLCFPYILFISGVALCMGILNSAGHFLAPALAPSVLNVVMISTALMSQVTGWNIAVGQAAGVLVAGLLQFLLQQPFLARIGFSWRGAFSFGDKAVRRMGKLMLPSVFGAAVYQFNILMATVLASYLPTGSVSYLYFADRLVQLPLGVFGVAVGTAALPSLSGLAARGEMDEFRSTLNSSLSLTLFIGLPATAGLAAMAQPIVATLFGRGAFTPEAVSATAMAVAAYAAGLPAFACVRTLVSSYYALENTRTPVLVGFVCMIANVGLGWLLMGPLGHVGLALAASAASWINVLLLGTFLTRRLGSWWTITSKVAVSTLLSAAMGVCAWYAGRLGAVSLAFIPALVALYCYCASLLGLGEALLIRDLFASRLARLSAKLQKRRSMPHA